METFPEACGPSLLYNFSNKVRTRWLPQQEAQTRMRPFTNLAVASVQSRFSKNLQPGYPSGSPF